MIFRCCMLHAEIHGKLLASLQWYLQVLFYVESGSLSLALLRIPQTPAENSWSFFSSFYTTLIILRMAAMMSRCRCLPLLVISTYSGTDYASDNPISGLWHVNRLSRVNYEPDGWNSCLLPPIGCSAAVAPAQTRESQHRDRAVQHVALSQQSHHGGTRPCFAASNGNICKQWKHLRTSGVLGNQIQAPWDQPVHI